MFSKLFAIALCALLVRGQSENDVKGRIAEAIQAKFDEVKVDFAVVNERLAMFNLPPINSNLLELVLTTYNTNVDALAEAIVNSKGDVMDLIKTVNSVFQSDLLYVEDEALRVNLLAFNEIAEKTKENYVEEFASKHRFLGYFFRKFVDRENGTYYPEIKNKVEGTRLPIEAIKAQIQPRVKLNSIQVRSEPIDNSTILEKIINPIKESFSEMALSMKGILHSSIEDLETSLDSLYKDGEPENFFERIYASTVNVAVVQIKKVLDSIVGIIDGFLDRVIISDEAIITRKPREALQVELTFLQKISTSINKTLRKFVTSLIISANNLTDNYLTDILNVIDSLVGGLVDTIFPNYEMRLINMR